LRPGELFPETKDPWVERSFEEQRRQIEVEKLRKQQREQERRIKELERRLAKEKANKRKNRRRNRTGIKQRGKVVFRNPPPGLNVRRLKEPKPNRPKPKQEAHGPYRSPEHYATTFQ
jgi:hypothetical protein